MKQESLLSQIDHTLLSVTANWEEVQALCDQGMTHGVASVCIPPRFVRKASRYVAGKVKICTVIGFPNGYNTPESKIFETEEAVRNGADEIDVVMAIGLAKAGDWEGVLTELRGVKTSCGGRILKVIVETSLLTEEEKVSACRAVTMSGADFIKTSTGFAGGGATVADIALFQANCGPDMRIKASGGINTVEDAVALVEAGAHRLGSSKLLGLIVQD